MKWLRIWLCMLGYDINGDGKVTVKEFKRIMARTGKLWNVQALLQVQPILKLFSGKMNEADIQKMVDKVDIDNDGSIDFKEFKKMME